MFKYVLTTVLAICLSLSALAQDQKKPVPHASPETVAHVSTFNLLTFHIVENSESVLKVLVTPDGKAQCEHVTVSESPDFKKTSTIDVEAKLTAAELKSLNDAFDKLKVETLKTTELTEKDTEPTKWIGIHAVCSRQSFSYCCSIEPKNDSSKEFTAFVAVVLKIAERLK